MNDHGSKKILFNKSTLFSLKAELLRKQEEVNEKKHLPKHRLENFKPPVAKEKNVDKQSKKSFKDSLKAVDTEELEACRKAKSALEKKTELYEHLSNKAGNSQLAGKFLVDFDSKKKQEELANEEIEEKTSTSEHVLEQNNEENEWTEFTDCLGRTRKCHISDLDMFMKRDHKLMNVMTKSNSNEEEIQVSDTPAKEKPLLVQKTNDYLQSLREKWEQKEQELLAKDQDIHYQDLLFDEARIHGVGYYAFSTEEAERKKQMEELLKQREETLKAQQDAEQVRKKRDEMMAARVAAARARQRARAGLPPEEPPEPNQRDFNTCLMEFLTQQKNEADAKAMEEERKLKDAEEEERQKQRDSYVREWDIGKEGVEDKLKKFREMSQEEYVELQRNKRINEFAPPQTSTSGNSNVFDDRGRMLYADETSNTKVWSDVRPNTSRPSPPPKIGDVSQLSQQMTWEDVRPRVKTPSPPFKNDFHDMTEKGLYFTSNKKKESNIKYKNFVKAQEATPILNEIDDVNIISYSEARKLELNSTEIAPPPTYDYYGPVPKKTKFKKPFESDIREAYAQGTKSLETKSSNRKLSQHYDFTLD